MNKRSMIPVERIEQSIYLMRGLKVMLDRDLAALYGIETRVLNQAVTRNIRRFPDDFMLELTRAEIRNISQTVTCSVFDALNELMAPPEPKRKPIGFNVNDPGTRYRAKRLGTGVRTPPRRDRGAVGD